MCGGDIIIAESANGKELPSTNSIRGLIPCEVGGKFKKIDLSFSMKTCFFLSLFLLNHANTDGSLTIPFYNYRDLLFAKLMEFPPVLVVDSKPLAVPRADIDIDGAEVIVFLVSRGPSTWHLHIQLYRVHAQDGVSNVGQKVSFRTGHLYIYQIECKGSSSIVQVSSSKKPVLSPILNGDVHNKKLPLSYIEEFWEFLELVQLCGPLSVV